MCVQRYSRGKCAISTAITKTTTIFQRRTWPYTRAVSYTHLGFILALVQGITAEPIDKANKAAAQKAYQAVFSDAKSFQKYDYDADEADKLVSDAGYKDTIDDIETALDSNKETLGYVITCLLYTSRCV